MSSSWGNLPRYGEFEIAGARENKPRLLGEGSFGKTFEAVRTNKVAGAVLEERFALKVLKPGLLSSDAKRFQFVQELTALTKFKHQNLIHLMGCGEDSGEVFYVMELCQGGDLAKLPERFGPLEERVAALIGLQVAKGLKEVHQRHRLVHRDIKPSNIMLADALPLELGVHQLALHFASQESLCRIVDFGLVHFALNAQEGAPGADHYLFAGSPMYASREAIHEQPVDARTDIYSLGMTLWYLVQGKGPLLDATGRPLSAREAFNVNASEEEHPPETFPRHLSPKFRQLLSRMIAKRPERRFSSAGELLEALRQFLETDTPPETNFRVLELRTLERQFRLLESFPSRVGKKCYVAEDNKSGKRVKLTLVGDLEGHDAPKDPSATAEKLRSMAEISCRPTYPDSLLKVWDVIKATDALAYTEELPPRLTLAEVLRMRYQRHRLIPFSEAVVILQPIAEALDFLLQHGRDKVLLACEEIWLAGIPQNAAIPFFSQWNDFLPRFSMMVIHSEATPHFEAGTSVSASQQISEFVRHPVPAFARLMYRIINGAEAAAAAEFAPNAYVPKLTLEPASNHLLRDLICQRAEWTRPTQILGQICAYEGAKIKEAPPDPHRTHPSDRSPNEFKGERTSEEGEKPTRGSIGPVEVVKPCRVISPFDLERREVEVAPEQWKPNEEIRCPFTKKVFRLPKKLDLLVATVVAPGVVHSPFDDPGETMTVPWKEWQASGIIICSATGKRLRLPGELPYPEATLAEPGVVLSPYDLDARIAVPGESWQPGKSMECPQTHWQFVLPRDLPPLAALADPAFPGVLESPYTPGITWNIAPERWRAGEIEACPETQRPLFLPRAVESWPVKVRVMDAARRLVCDPSQPRAVVAVPVQEWFRGNTFTSHQGGRPLVLPADLPLLVGEVSAQRLGQVRSPYTGEWVEVGFRDWLPGHEVSSHTAPPFVLPQDLPALIPVGAVSANRPGYALSPWAPSIEFQVDPAQWRTSQQLTCPTTRNPFRLPDKLPPLEALVRPGRFGTVASPFAPGTPVDVPLDLWVPGLPLTCQQTGQPFVLPADLPEWLVDGTWVKRKAACIFSPFKSHPEVEITEFQWVPGALLRCPETGRSFRAPIDEGFPSLAMEKAAVEQALKEPNATETDAAQTLICTCPQANAALIRSVWVRHNLDTPQKRKELQKEGTLVPGRPGVVRSPHGRKAQVDVVPISLWAQPDATLPCPETGWHFLLPKDRPPLLAGVLPGRPGMFTSPYEPAKEFPAQPDEWEEGQLLRCPSSGHALRFPAKLPDWTPPGILLPDQLNSVLSPFQARPKVGVTNEQWNPGQVLVCPVTKKKFALPKDLPPLYGELTAKPGVVRSPYGPRPGAEVTVVPVGAWAERNASLLCPRTGRPFWLPEERPPLLAGVLPGRPGTLTSPYASNQEFPLQPDEWEAKRLISCPFTQHALQLPASLPEWPAPGFVDPSRPNVAFSPYGGNAESQVSNREWNPGQVLVCPATNKKFSLPQDLPPLLAEKADGGSIESPYLPGFRFQVSPDEWLAGHVLPCLKTRRAIRLPDPLPLVFWPGELVPGKPGMVRSPFGHKLEVAVPGPDWRPQAPCRCPVTGREFFLPAVLPPLLALLIIDSSQPDEVARGRVLSPYWADFDLPPASHSGDSLWSSMPGGGVHYHAVDMEQLPPGPEVLEVSPGDWERGREIQCRDGRTCMLPEVPPWEVEADLAPGKVGVLCSPYRAGQEVLVPPAQWLPGTRIQCPASKRFFLLPHVLPLLEGKMLDGGKGLVSSPFDERHEPQSVPPEAWIPGGTITCEKTRRDFALPSVLPDLEATPVPGKPGCVFNPYVRRQEVTVPGPRWVAGEHIMCLSTGRHFVLPEDIPPLIGTLVNGLPFIVQSPYTSATARQEVTVPTRRWVPGAPVVCPATKRVFLLPAQLPVVPRRATPWGRIAGIGTAVAACAAGLVLYVGLHQPHEDSGTVADGGAVPELSLSDLVHKHDSLSESWKAKEWDEDAARRFLVAAQSLAPKLGRESSDLSKLQDMFYDTAVAYWKQDSAGQPELIEMAQKDSQSSSFLRLLSDFLLLGDKSGVERELELLMRSKVRPAGYFLNSRYHWGSSYGLLLGRLKDGGKAESEAVNGALQSLLEAAHAEVKWAQDKLMHNCVATGASSQDLTVADPEGRIGKIKIPRSQWKKGHPYHYKDQGGRWFRLPPDLTDPPPRRIVFQALPRIEQWTEGELPAGLSVRIAGLQPGLLTFNKSGGMAADLPVSADDKLKLTLVLELSGWKTNQVEVSVSTSDEDFVAPEITLNRATGSLQVEIPSVGCDYDTLEMQWVGSLNGENTPEPRQKVTTLKISGTAKGRSETSLLYTGTYRQTLKSSKNGQCILPYALPKDLDIDTETPQSLILPPSLAGGYYGLAFNYEKIKDGRFFAALTLDRGVTSVSFLVQAKVVRVGSDFDFAQFAPEQNAAGPAENIRLTNPNNLEFDCVLTNFTYHCVLNKEANDALRMYTLMTRFAPTNDAGIQSMRSHVSQTLRSLAKAHPEDVAICQLAKNMSSEHSFEEYKKSYLEALVDANASAKKLNAENPTKQIELAESYFQLFFKSQTTRLTQKKGKEPDLELKR